MPVPFSKRADITPQELEELKSQLALYKDALKEAVRDKDAMSELVSDAVDSEQILRIELELFIQRLKKRGKL